MPATGETVESGNSLRHICMHLCDVFSVDMILCRSIISFELDIPTQIY